jgi:hypothetical protein
MPPRPPLVLPVYAARVSHVVDSRSSVNHLLVAVPAKNVPRGTPSVSIFLAPGTGPERTLASKSTPASVRYVRPLDIDSLVAAATSKATAPEH